MNERAEMTTVNRHKHDSVHNEDRPFLQTVDTLLGWLYNCARNTMVGE